MDNKNLRAQLIELHKELETAATPNDDRLAEMMTDIVRVASGEKLEPEEGRDLRDQLEQHASNFNTDYPKTAAVIHEVASILAKLGI